MTTSFQMFGRSLRDEPGYGIYPYKIYLVKNEVSKLRVETWLAKRYAEGLKGHKYRTVTYNHADGNKYVDFIWMETCSEQDLVEIKMRWGVSEVKISRGKRVPRRRLNTQQRRDLDAIIERARIAFFNSLDT